MNKPNYPNKDEAMLKQLQNSLPIDPYIFDIFFCVVSFKMIRGNDKSQVHNWVTHYPETHTPKNKEKHDQAIKMQRSSNIKLHISI